ncbi:MAG: hypothetical protein QOI85_1607 [Chloroflexota bacterium]|jgi:hypothetical protein|nr:hypothetical protein [Chloroflexota bacterium]
MPLGLAFAIVLAVGLTLAVASVIGLRSAGAHLAVARRLAGPPEVKVGRLLGVEALPKRAVRVVGRIRCREPLEMGGGEQLVAYHRDVEVRIGAAWRSIERLRETRSFDLWDHDGSLSVDPSLAAEPLIVIPNVWHGDPAELQEPHASAVARLAERHGPAAEARATTRTINVTDRVRLLAQATLDEDGRARLEPPDGGYLITSLELDEAMRLLGGGNRRLVTASILGLFVSSLLVAVGAIGAVLTALLAT